MTRAMTAEPTRRIAISVPCQQAGTLPVCFLKLSSRGWPSNDTTTLRPASFLDCDAAQTWKADRSEQQNNARRTLAHGWRVACDTQRLERHRIVRGQLLSCEMRLYAVEELQARDRCLEAPARLRSQNKRNSGRRTMWVVMMP